MAFVFGFSLIQPIKAQYRHPKIAKFQQPMARRRRMALETALLALPDRDLAGFEGLDNRLTIIIS